MSEISKNNHYGLRASAMLIPMIAGSMTATMFTTAAAQETFMALEEIVVSARKVEENLQNAPISITAFSGQGLEDRNINSVADIGLITPGLVFDTNAPISGSSASASIFIRGIGQVDFLMTTDPGVGLYIDGVYVARSVGSATDLIDVERVEILRGPQGTLFGRNTIGGAISLISKKPNEEFGGKVSATTGSDNRLDMTAKLDVPISDTFLTSYAVSYKTRDGYVKNLQGGPDQGNDNSLSGRASFLWNASETVEVYVNIDGTRDRETSAGGSLLAVNELSGFVAPLNAVFSGDPSCAPPVSEVGNPNCYNSQWLVGPYQTNATYATDANNPDFRSASDLDLWGISAQVTWDISPNMTVKSITAYRDMEAFFARDADHSPQVLNHTQNLMTHSQLTQELQVNGTSFEDSLRWVTGVYYFEEQGHDINIVTFPVVNLLSGGFIDNKSYAAFGQATYDITQSLHLTAGMRYTQDKKNFLPDQYILDPKLLAGAPIGIGGTPIQAGSRALPMINTPAEIDNFSMMVNLSYDVSEDLMVYGSYSEGFKGGGHSQRVFPPLPVAPTFEPEYVKVYEAGFKYTGLENRLRVNGAAFYTDYSDIQLIVLEGIAPIWTNAAEARVQGFELEVTYLPMDGLLIESSVGYLDAKYTEMSAAARTFGLSDGNAFVNTPEWSLSTAISYVIPVSDTSTLTPRIDWSYRSEVFNDALNTPEIVQEGFHLVNINIAYDMDDSGLSFVFGVTNLTDKRYFTSAFSDLPTAGIAEATFARPREWWLKAKYSF